MKKILFLIMLAVVPASAFAEYNFYTYGNGAMLHSTYNAIAMIFNDSGFINLTRFVFILAFLASFYMTAFLKRWDVLKYAIISFFILGLFLYSKDRVVIHDVIQDELYVVDNVPKAFGFLGESVSSAGHFITEKFDTAFAVPITTLLFGKSNAMPLNLTYSKSGFAGPFKMIKDLGSFELPDQQIQADFYEYVKKCAKWDVMGLNSSEMKIFKENLKLSSPDVIPNGLSSRFYVPVTIGGVKSQCATYYVANLYPRIVASIGGSEAILSSEPKLLNYMSGLSSSMAFFTGESLTTYNAMTQSAVVKTAIRSLSGSLANGREEYNQFMAELGIAKFEQQGEVISRVAMKLIPIFRNVMEILMIATLPIVFLLFLLPNGYKLIWEYILSLIWLQLWNPILAVMQMVMNLSAVMEASAAGKVTEIGGFTIHSFGYWGDFSNSYLAVAGYMMISVPMLAHLVLRGGKFMGAQLGQGLASAAMGAGAMSVDPNAVKGAGYLTAEEKALNESGIEKMFMIQNMHNAGAARNIDAANRFAAESEIAANQGMDRFGDYSQVMAKAGASDSFAGAKSTLDAPQKAFEGLMKEESYHRQMGERALSAGDVGRAQQHFEKADNMRDMIGQWDRNQNGILDPGKEQDMMNFVSTRQKTEQYAGAINKEANGVTEQDIGAKAAWDAESGTKQIRNLEQQGVTASDHGRFNAAQTASSMQKYETTLGKNFSDMNNDEIAGFMRQEKLANVTWSNGDRTTTASFNDDGSINYRSDVSGDKETVYKGAYKEDGSWERNHNQVDTAKTEKNRDNIDTAKTVIDRSVMKDDSTTLKTGNEIQIKDSYKNEAYGYEINGEQIIFEKNAVANMLSTEDGRKHFASLASQFGASGDGRQEIFTTAVKQNLADTLEKEGKISSDYKMGMGVQGYGEAHAGFEKKLNDKIPVVGGVNAGASIGAKIDVHGSADQGRSRNEIVSRIDEKMDAVYDMEKIATKAGIGGGFSTERYGQTVSDVLRSEMNDIRGDISKDAPLIELGKKGLDTIQEAGNFYSEVGKNYKDVQAHGDPESSDTGTPETKATLADLK